MSSPWGPVLDAELAYRRARARNDYRPSRRHLKPADNRGESPDRQVSAQQVSAQQVSAQQPLLPAPRRPADREKQPVHAA